MKVQVSGTFSESNGIDPVTTCDPSDQLGGPLHHTPPLAGFISAEVDGASAVSPRIKQTPTEQRSRQRVMSQQPEITAPDLMGSQLGIIAVKSTDSTRRVSLLKNHGHRGAT